jgi:hypothetical protein
LASVATGQLQTSRPINCDWQRHYCRIGVSNFAQTPQSVWRQVGGHWYRLEWERKPTVRIEINDEWSLTDMKAILGCAALALVMVSITIPADAKGCIKGAAVGAAAGHFAGHHGLLGAAAGCAIGHHEANKHENATHDAH